MYAIKEKTDTNFAFVNWKETKMVVCLCCEFYNAWISNSQVSSHAEKCVRIGKELYEKHRNEFDEMICDDMEAVAKNLFKDEINFGRVVAFLVFGVVHFPEQKQRTCKILRNL